MARGRFVSKGISLDEKVHALSDDTCRLLFTWLIAHLDCEGRMYGDAQTVKSIVFPRRSIKTQTVEKYLRELEVNGLILRYSAPGGLYLWMENFEKHQPGLRKDKESASQIPPFTPDLGRSEDGNGLTQDKEEVKDKDKEEDKEEDKEDISPSLSPSLSFNDVLDVYRANVGEPSDDMENELKLATTKFSPLWVIEAIGEARDRGKSDWRYIARILENWRKFGRSTKGNRQDPDRFVRGKYGHLVQR